MLLGCWRWKAAQVLSSGELCELQIMANLARYAYWFNNVMNVMGVTNNFVIGRKACFPGGNSCLVLETWQRTYSLEVLDPMRVMVGDAKKEVRVWQMQEMVMSPGMPISHRNSKGQEHRVVCRSTDLAMPSGWLQASDLRNCQAINLCCVKLSWQFITAAKGDQCTDPRKKAINQATFRSDLSGEQERPQQGQVNNLCDSE